MSQKSMKESFIVLTFKEKWKKKIIKEIEQSGLSCLAFFPFFKLQSANFISQIWEIWKTLQIQDKTKSSETQKSSHSERHHNASFFSSQDHLWAHKIKTPLFILYFGTFLHS